jgi:hypothetical protein
MIFQPWARLYLTNVVEPVFNILPALIALETFSHGLAWYIFGFNGNGTSKPQWIEWLG